MSRPNIAKLAKTALAAVCVWVLSACGSTVQWSDTIADGASPGDVLGEDSLSTPAISEATDSHGGIRSGATGDSPGGATRDSPATGDSPGGATRRSRTATATTPSGLSGRGFNDKEIYIGYATDKGASQFYSQFGADVSSFDQEAIANTIVKDINGRGGIAGRQVVLAFHDTSSANFVQDQNGSMQRWCEAWTNDRPTFAVIDLLAVGGALNDTLKACLAKRETIYQDNSSYPRYEREYSRYYPYFYAPPSASYERLIKVWIDRISARGYFDKWDPSLGRPGNNPVKVGIQSNNDNFERLMRQHLRRHGHEPVVYRVNPKSVAEHGRSASEEPFFFRRNNVTHQLSIQAGASVSAKATRYESQQYRPRFAITSLELPAYSQNGNRDQLRGTLGVGFVPQLDVDSRRDPGVLSAAQTRCRKLMQGSGQDTSDRTVAAYMFRACDGFRFLASAIENGGLSAIGIQRRVHAIGTMPSAYTFQLSFSQGRTDGVSAVRDLAYREDCGRGNPCFAYSSSKNRGL